MRKKKHDFIDIPWKSDKVRVFFDNGNGWKVVSLNHRPISQEDKILIIKAILTNVS